MSTLCWSANTLAATPDGAAATHRGRHDGRLGTALPWCRGGRLAKRWAREEQRRQGSDTNNPGSPRRLPLDMTWCTDAQNSGQELSRANAPSALHLVFSFHVRSGPLQNTTAGSTSLNRGVIATACGCCCRCHCTPSRPAVSRAAVHSPEHAGRRRAAPWPWCEGT